MADSYIKNYFPSQVASDLEKISSEYGLKVAKAIESEWFYGDYGTQRFRTNFDNYHRLRLYARGEQSVQKYKDELSINGDLSYLNLDWRPVPIIPKFVDIVVNGIAERTYDVKAFSQDPYGVSKRTEYMESLLDDMRTKELNVFTKQAFGIDIANFPEEKLPDSQEELELHMQLTYKQAIETAEEQAINVLFEANKYELTKKRFYYDLTVLGIGCVKNTFNNSEGIKVDYVDPANLVYSYTESPYFEDIYYVGEIKTIPINELKKEFPNLSQEDLEEIERQPTSYAMPNNRSSYDKTDNNQIDVLYFNYKTYMNEVYKIKTTATGSSKVLIKDDTFDPPVEVLDSNFEKISRSIEVLYEGVLILGTDKLLKWQLATNMMRPKSDNSKVKMNYAIVAPRMYRGRVESLVGRITGFADMIQLTHLKIQQVMSRLIPDGVYLDADGIAEIDLGNGTNYNPQEALNMFFQTGSVIGRSMTSDGDMNPGKVPIQEIASGSGGAKMQSLIGNYNYYLQMIRDVTGLNEARDGSTPDKNALVGLQKIALHLHDFGIFLEIEPDEEEKQRLENNIQAAVAQQGIDLEDAIDLRQIKNVKLANQLLKIKRRKKFERDQIAQQQNIQAQANANAQAQQVAAQAEVQKQQSLVQINAQLEQLRAQLDAQKMEQETFAKKELMQLKFQYDLQLKQLETAGLSSREKQKEDRKDERTKIQASQQSELIDQRKKNKPPKNFESLDQDMIGNNVNLGGFNQ